MTVYGMTVYNMTMNSMTVYTMTVYNMAVFTMTVYTMTISGGLTEGREKNKTTYAKSVLIITQTCLKTKTNTH